MTGIAIAFTGMLLALKSLFSLATFCMVLAGVCDAFDGKLARKYEYEKKAMVYGVQLDSLADVVCSGVFPVILTVAQSPYLLTYIACGFYLLCGVIRLAYFNTMAADENAEKNVYIGVPITTITIVYPLFMIVTHLVNEESVRFVMPAVLAVLGILYILRIRIRKPDIFKIAKSFLNRYTVNFVLFPLFILFASDVYYKLNFEANFLIALLDSSKNHFIPFVFAYLYIAVAFYALVCIFGCSKTAKIVSSIVLVLLLTVNDIKYTIMGIPVQLSDVHYLNPDNIAMMGTATTTIGKWIFKVFLKSTMVGLACLTFILFDRKENSFKFEKSKKRLISLLISVILLIVPSALGSFASPALLSAYGLNSDSILLLPQANELYYDYGYYQGLFLDSISSYYAKPSGYDRDQIDKAIAEVGDKQTDGAWGKANVVFILSETFSDLENLEEVTFKSSLMPNIDSYTNESDKIVFDLLVAPFGGASVNTEFEILTGSSLSLWPSGYIPYTAYYNDYNGSFAPNIIKEFNNNGYETMYLTPWGNTSYNSEYVYTLFGTDEKIYGDSLSGESKGYYYSDASLMNDIFEQLKDTTEGNYKFIMTATAQNHFPYDEDRFPITDIEAESSTLNDEQLGMIRSYAQGIYDADKELNNLYEKIQTLDVPTIIVFYGDHLPHIVDSKENKPYLDSAYFNTDDAGVNELRKHTTKAVILSNFDLDTSDDLEYISASYLGAYVLNKLDLKISNYFKYIDYARTILPVYNRQYVYSSDGLRTLDNLTEDEEVVLNNLKFAKYRNFYDFEGK